MSVASSAAPSPTPSAVSRDAGATWLHVLEYNLLGYRRTFRANVFTSFVQPVLFLTAMGLGLGGIVDRSAGAGSLAATSYLAFLAPGLLAATGMQTAFGESTYPIIAGFRWNRTFHAMAATPLSSWSIVLGQLAYVVVRVALVAGIFSLVIVAFGAAGSPAGLLLAFLATVLTGLAFATPLIAFSATRDTPGSFSSLVRFGITPMFLFSGSFFPVERLPGVLQPLAALTPLYHGVALARGFVLGTLDPLTAAGHAAYLAAFAGLGLVACYLIVPRRLTG